MQRLPGISNNLHGFKSNLQQLSLHDGHVGQIFLVDVSGSGVPGMDRKWRCIYLQKERLLDCFEAQKNPRTPWLHSQKHVLQSYKHKRFFFRPPPKTKPNQTKLNTPWLVEEVVVVGVEVDLEVVEAVAVVVVGVGVDLVVAAVVGVDLVEVDLVVVAAVVGVVDLEGVDN
jgi:hypothetical protein